MPEPLPVSRSLVLEQAARRIAARLLVLDRELEAGDLSGWEEYVVLAQALAQLEQATSPVRTGRLMSTHEMAGRLGISPKTLLRRRARGEVEPALVMGKRGRGALRWQ